MTLQYPPRAYVLAFLSVLLSSLLSYVFHPKAWLMGPFGFWRRLTACMAQESGYNPGVAGDDGGSVGILQFSSDKSDWYGDGWRSSAFLSGWAAGRFIQGASWAWVWRCSLPFVGVKYVRYMWTHGYGDNPPTYDVVVTYYVTEARPAGGYLFGWLVTGVPTVLTLLLLWRSFMPRRRR